MANSQTLPTSDDLDGARRDVSPTGTFTMTSRLLRDGAGPALEIIEAHPTVAASGAPVLLVHGAFGGAWMWAEAVMPYLAGRGRSVIAVSLRGHGASEGGGELHGASLDDFATDLRRVADSLSQAPVVVGHSLGGLLAQRLIGRMRMRGLCLMASLPPEGMALVGPRAAMTDPQIWLEAFLGSMAHAKAPVVAAAHQMFFAEGVPPERISRYAAAMGPESPRALAEAHVAGAIASAATIRLPVLVLGGIGDRLVWRSCVMRTALYHAARYAFLGDVGHFMMLDPGAKTASKFLNEWLDAEQL